MVGKSAQWGFREADAKARPFKTAYYDPDVHQAAFKIPPFLREKITGAR
jgi:spermidine synthase